MKTQKKRAGRPPKGSDQLQTEYLDVRLRTPEKQGFQEAAELAGMALSAWVRERLRQVARKELEQAGRPVPFIQQRGR
jgi:uncharacterized protein (DUF1778 family)